MVVAAIAESSAWRLWACRTGKQVVPAERSATTRVDVGDVLSATVTAAGRASLRRMSRRQGRRLHWRSGHYRRAGDEAIPSPCAAP